MPPITQLYYCWHEDCRDRPPFSVTMDVPDGPTDANSGSKEIVVFCPRHHANKITIPKNWNPQHPTLGERGSKALYGRRP